MLYKFKLVHKVAEAAGRIHSALKGLQLVKGPNKSGLADFRSETRVSNISHMLVVHLSRQRPAVGENQTETS